MPRPTSLFLATAVAITALTALAKDTTYHDPRNPSFSVLVPDGWTASKTDNGVSLNHDSSSIMLFAVTGSRPPADMAADIAAQFQKQGKNFRTIDKGECRFGGQKGAYVLFSEVSPNGKAEVNKVVTMTNGQLVYTMIMEIPPDQFESEKLDLQRIQDSFIPEAIATTVDDREKLEALYAAGVINQQEYEARKKNLGGGGTAPGSASPGNANDSGSSAAGSGSNSNAQKLAALDQAYRSGVLTREEYENKKRQLEGQADVTSSTSGDTGSYESRNRFQAPDGSYSTDLPAGWTSQHVGSGAMANDTFFPTNGGEERIIVSSMAAAVNLEQMVLGLANITTGMFPILRLTEKPAYGQIGGSPAAELHYAGVLPNGARISAWQGVRLIAGKYYSVFSVAQSNRAAAVEADAEAMLRSLRPNRTH